MSSIATQKPGSKTDIYIVAVLFEVCNLILYSENMGISPLWIAGVDIFLSVHFSRYNFHRVIPSFILTFFSVYRNRKAFHSLKRGW